jgi:hypothetical protein
MRACYPQKESPNGCNSFRHGRVQAGEARNERPAQGPPGWGGSVDGRSSMTYSGSSDGDRQAFSVGSSASAVVCRMSHLMRLAAIQDHRSLFP